MSVNINFSRLINYVYFSQLLVFLAVGVVGGPMGNESITVIATIPPLLLFYQSQQ